MHIVQRKFQSPFFCDGVPDSKENNVKIYVKKCFNPLSAVTGFLTRGKMGTYPIKAMFQSPFCCDGAIIFNEKLKIENEKFLITPPGIAYQIAMETAPAFPIPHS